MKLPSRTMETIIESDSIGDDGLPVMHAPPAWYWMLLGRIIVLSIVGLSLWYYQFESLFVIIILFILVVPMEKLFPRHKGQKVRRPKWRLDVTYALSQPFLNVFGVIFAVIISFFSFTWALGLIVRYFGLVEMIPGYIQPVVAFMLFDFFGYWAHRWYHEVPELQSITLLSTWIGSAGSASTPWILH